MKNLIYTCLVHCPFLLQETAPEKVVIRDDTMVTVTAPQFKSSAMEIASPTEQDFEVTKKQQKN
jgi:cobalt-zinc-cadmium efflux system membrane fusion protein